MASRAVRKVIHRTILTPDGPSRRCVGLGANRTSCRNDTRAAAGRFRDDGRLPSSCLKIRLAFTCPSIRSVMHTDNENLRPASCTGATVRSEIGHLREMRGLLLIQCDRISSRRWKTVESPRCGSESFMGDQLSLEDPPAPAVSQSLTVPLSSQHVYIIHVTVKKAGQRRA